MNCDEQTDGIEQSYSHKSKNDRLFIENNHDLHQADIKMFDVKGLHVYDPM